jgi:hypothetical protein
MFIMLDSAKLRKLHQWNISNDMFVWFQFTYYLITIPWIKCTFMAFEFIVLYWNSKCLECNSSIDLMFIVIVVWFRCSTGGLNAATWCSALFNWRETILFANELRWFKSFGFAYYYSMFLIYSHTYTVQPLLLLYLLHVIQPQD